MFAILTFIMMMIVTFLIFNLIQRSRKFKIPRQALPPQKRYNRRYRHHSNRHFRRRRGSGFSSDINFGSDINFDNGSGDSGSDGGSGGDGGA